MHSSLLRHTRILPILVALTIVALTTACDATGETGSDTIVLSDPANPTVVTYEFEYNPAQAVGGEVGATSSNTDNLSSILSAYGRSRSDVASARVESITISQSTGGSVTTDKLFPYVQNVALYLGNNEAGTALADSQPVDSGLQANLTATGNDVTATVQSGPSPAFLVIDVEDTNESQGFIEAEVEYEIRVTSE